LQKRYKPTAISAQASIWPCWGEIVWWNYLLFWAVLLIGGWLLYGAAKEK